LMMNILIVLFTLSFESRAAKTTPFVKTPTIPVKMAHHLKVKEMEKLLSFISASVVGGLSVGEVSSVEQILMPRKI